MLLLNPGPVTLTQRVRQALMGPDLCHREPEFSALQHRVRSRLLEIYGLDADKWCAVVITGSGTAAVEAMLASLVPRGAALGVIENGVYGERLARIAEAHEIPTQCASYSWGERVEPDHICEMLTEHPEVRQLALVHHETTTGRLNNLEEIASVCRARDVALLVDGVSSFGAEQIDFDQWPIAACAGVSNKCLHGVPGVSFVIVRRDALDALGSAQRTIYLDLSKHELAQRTGGTSFTPSVQCMYALDAAMDELFDAGGWVARHNHYMKLANAVREGLGKLGIQPMLPDGATSCVLQAFHMPRDVTYTRLHDELKECGFVIYAGQGALESGIFRVSTMGAIGLDDIQRFLHAVETIIDPALSVVSERES